MIRRIKFSVSTSTMFALFHFNRAIDQRPRRRSNPCRTGSNSIRRYSNHRLTHSSSSVQFHSFCPSSLKKKKKFPLSFHVVIRDHGITVESFFFSSLSRVSDPFPLIFYLLKQTNNLCFLIDLNSMETIRSNPSPPSHLTGRTRRNFLNNRRRSRQNDRYRHECPPFAIPNDLYTIRHLHRFMSIESVVEIIDHCRECRRYSMDTESDEHDYTLSLLQVHSIPMNLPSIVLLINLKHLPSPHSLLFEQFATLFQILFRGSNTIYSWGSMERELAPLMGSPLLNAPMEATLFDLQGAFNDWYRDAVSACLLCFPNGHFPDLCDHQCPYQNNNAPWSLQNAIRYSFGLFLDKQDTRQRWSAMLDPEYATIGRSKLARIITYATNDVLAVTYLHRPIEQKWKLSILQSSDVFALLTSTEGLCLDDNSPPVILNEATEEEEDQITIEPSVLSRNDSLVRRQVHFVNEVDSQCDERIDQSDQANENKETNEVIHRRASLDNDDVEHRSKQPSSRRSIEARKRRNQHRNRIRRASRDRHLIIRGIYHRFTLRQVKEQLMQLQIKHAHLRLDKVNRWLYIGLKRPEQIDLYFDRLPGDLFDRRHYCQEYTRREK